MYIAFFWETILIHLCVQVLQIINFQQYIYA